MQSSIFNTIRRRALGTTLIAIASVASTGCYSIDYREVAYSVLRHEDCRRNEIDTFCTRSYATDYQEYERIRSEFLKDSKVSSETENPWVDSSENSTTL